MPRNLENKISQKETEDTGLSLFAELEEKTKHLNNTPATKAELWVRLLEEKGFEVPQEKRIKYYVNYVFEVIEKETEENKTKKILEILEKDKIFTKEELKILMMEKEVLEKKKISEEDEKKIKKAIQKDKNISRWIKRLLLFGTMLLTPLSGKKGPVVPEEAVSQKAKIETIIKKEVPQKESLEKVPADLEKPVKYFKDLEFIKGAWYILDKSNRKSPILNEMTEDGKIALKDTVGIGRDEGDDTKGFTTPAGIYMFSDWLTKEDKRLYGEGGVLRLLGYAINGEQVGDIGVHVIYPPEKKERMEKMLSTDSSKRFSFRCINAEEELFKRHILPNFDKAGGTGKLFIVIMQEGNVFDEEKWGKIVQKMSRDVKLLESIDKK